MVGQSRIRNRMKSKVSRPPMSDNDAHRLAKTKSSKTEKEGEEEALENMRERENPPLVERRNRDREKRRKRKSKEKDRIKKKKERRGRRKRDG